VRRSFPRYFQIVVEHVEVGVIYICGMPGRLLNPSNPFLNPLQSFSNPLQSLIFNPLQSHDFPPRFPPLRLPYHPPIISSSFPHHFLIISSSFPHHFLIISSSFPHHFLIISSSFPHPFLIISSSFPHHFLIISSSFPHHFLIISSSCLTVLRRTTEGPPLIITDYDQDKDPPIDHDLLIMTSLAQMKGLYSSVSSIYASYSLSMRRLCLIYYYDKDPLIMIKIRIPPLIMIKSFTMKVSIRLFIDPPL
jgi:hypothetical protein